MARTAVIAGTATAVSGRVRANQDHRAQQAQAHHAQQDRPAPPGGDMVDTLSRLAELNKAGALTDEEFAAAKARILASG
jgi:hypothetical protein